jgi:hypothetical protein
LNHGRSGGLSSANLPVLSCPFSLQRGIDVSAGATFNERAAALPLPGI